MKPYTLKADDYKFIHQEIIKHQFNNTTSEIERVKANTAIFMLVKNELTSHGQLGQAIKEGKYDQLPPKEIKSLQDVKNWPYLDNYELQKSLYLYFYPKGFDVSYIIEQGYNNFVFKSKVLSTYAKGIMEGIFKCDSEDQRWKIVESLDTKDDILFQFLGHYNWKNQEQYHKKLEKILDNPYVLNNSNFMDLLKNIKDVMQDCPKLSKEVLFKNDSMIEQEYIALKFSIDIAGLARQFTSNTKKNLVQEQIGKIFNHYQKKFPSSHMSVFPEKTEITMLFDDEKTKEEFKKEFKYIVSLYKESKFQVEQDLEAIIVSYKLHESLQSQLPIKEKNKSIKI